MTSKIAVVGSRAYSSEGLANVARHVRTLPRDSILVSGGAMGVDHVAEMAHGGRVFSFRTYEDQDTKHWGVEFWDYNKQTPLTGNVTRFDSFFATAKDALLYRNFLIAHECDALDIFWNGWSAGCKNTADLTQELGKEVHYR